MCGEHYWGVSLRICDTTLRDGEQMSGVVFSQDEKIELAKKFSELGIDGVELMPVVSNVEREVAKYLSGCDLGCEIMASTRMSREDVDLAIDCGADRAVLFSSLSDIHLDTYGVSRDENLRRTLDIVDYACDCGMKVDFAGEDSSRADRNYLIDFVGALRGKVDYFLACDTMGIWWQDEVARFVRDVRDATGVKVGLHLHNDLGQAVANSLTGVRAGAEMVSGTFTGIGERAGNAALEEILVGLNFQHGVILDVKYEMLGEVCDLVSKYSGVGIHANKPIVGGNAYCHESGRHVDAMMKNGGCYENYSPDEVGRERSFVYGKQSGVGGLKGRFGKRFSDKVYYEGLREIKARSIEEKRSFGVEEAEAILREVKDVL